MIFGFIMLEGASAGSASPSYTGHRYPVEVISQCVWLYFRFPLSFREVEELVPERGVTVSYETEIWNQITRTASVSPTA